MESLGRHLLIDLWGCNREINNPQTVRQAMVDVVEAVNATILNIQVHAFRPSGVTGLAMLAESHLSVHSWPEHGFVAVDIFTCSTVDQQNAVLDVLRRVFEPDSCEIHELRRGLRPNSPQPVHSLEKERT
jgi:S-adenosylmethionine decarboxylase proenzyme